MIHFFTLLNKPLARVETHKVLMLDKLVDSPEIVILFLSSPKYKVLTLTYFKDLI